MKNEITVKQIVIEYLKINGYDGLYCDYNDRCGCGLEDLMPCDGNNTDHCIAGHARKDPTGEVDFLIFPGKRRGRKAAQ
jgi:hypothetical protein